MKIIQRVLIGKASKTFYNLDSQEQVQFIKECKIQPNTWMNLKTTKTKWKSLKMPSQMSNLKTLWKFAANKTN